MANIVTNIHVNYIDCTGGPQSESLDPEELDEGYIDFNAIIDQWVKTGCTDIVIKIDTRRST